MPGADGIDGGRRPVRMAYLAAGWALIFGLLHLYWASGGETGLRFSLALKGQAETDLIHDPAFRLQGLWGVVVLCWLASAIALSTVRPWGERLPTRLRLIGAWGVTVVLLLRAFFYSGFVFSTLRLFGIVAIGADADRTWYRWDLILWSPWFVLGAFLFGRTAQDLARRSAQETDDQART